MRLILGLTCLCMVATLGCGEAGAGGRELPTASIGAPMPPEKVAARLVGLWATGEQKASTGDDTSERMERAIAAYTFKFEFRNASEVWIQFDRDLPAEQGTWELVGNDSAGLIVRIASPTCGQMDFAVSFIDENRFTMRQLGASDDALAFTLTRLRAA